MEWKLNEAWSKEVATDLAANIIVIIDGFRLIADRKSQTNKPVIKQLTTNN